MPSNNWRGWSACRCELTRGRQIFEQLERTPDLSRGAQRLAAEVVLAEISGQDVPSFARERAFDTLNVMAKG